MDHVMTELLESGAPMSLVLVDRYPKIYSCMMTSESNCGLLARKDKHNGLVCYGVLPT